MSDLIIARSLGYPEYPEINIDDPSTFSRLDRDVNKYMSKRPWAPGYHCRIPGLGCTLVGLK